MWYIGLHVLLSDWNPFSCSKREIRYDARKNEVHICRSFVIWSVRKSLEYFERHSCHSINTQVNSISEPKLLTNLFLGSLSSFRGWKTMNRSRVFKDVLNASRLRWFITHWLIVRCFDSNASLVPRLCWGPRPSGTAETRRCYHGPRRGRTGWSLTQVVKLGPVGATKVSGAYSLKNYMKPL